MVFGEHPRSIAVEEREGLRDSLESLFQNSLEVLRVGVRGARGEGYGWLGHELPALPHLRRTTKVDFRTGWLR